MEKYLIGIKRKYNEDQENNTKENKTKSRKYDISYLLLGFTYRIINGKQQPMCLLCLKVLASDSMKPSKLKRHFETMHTEFVGKPKDFFQKKLDILNEQQKSFAKTICVPSKALLASYKVSHIIAKCKKPHSIGESLVLPAAIQMVSTMIGDSYADELRKIPLADNTVGRRISDMSDDICDQLTENLKSSYFALQVDEATDVAKDAHLITYVRYVLENEIKEDILFCKPIEGKSTAIEFFNIIDNFFKDNGLLWANCIGLCTDGAQSMAGKHAGLQTIVRNVAPRAIWTHCMLHRQSLVSKSMSSELLTVFDVIKSVVNFIKKQSIKRKTFRKTM